MPTHQSNEKDLLRCLKAVIAAMQRKTPWEDAKIILIEAEKLIAKIEKGGK